MFHQYEDERGKVRIYNIQEGAETLDGGDAYECMVQLPGDEDWRYVRQPATKDRPGSIDMPPALNGAAHAALSFACDAQARLDAWQPGILNVPPPSSWLPMRCGLVMVAFGVAGSRVVIVATESVNLSHVMQDCGSLADDCGLALGKDAPDSGVHVGVVIERVDPGYNNPNGYVPPELEFDVDHWVRDVTPEYTVVVGDDD